jgi:hypothetical protein
MTRLARNPQAIAEGADGAPGVSLLAWERPAAGEVTRYAHAADEVYSGTSFVKFFSQVLFQSGEIRFSFSHTAGNGGSTAEILVNSVVVASWATSAGATVQRSVDLPVSRGALIEARHKCNAAVVNYKSTIAGFSLKTSGAILIPTSFATSPSEWSLS